MSFVSTWASWMDCLLCGMRIEPGDIEFQGLAVRERPDWTQKELRGEHLVLATEVEETAFVKRSAQWAHFFRGVIEGPRPDSPLSLTGIGFRETDNKAVVPASPDKASIIAPNCAPHRKHQYKFFRARGDPSSTPFDHNHKKLPVGYPVHAHCRALVDAVIGRDVVAKNLRAFCETLYESWDTIPNGWHGDLGCHSASPSCRYSWRQPGVRQLRVEPPYLWTSGRRYKYAYSNASHASDSPLRLPKVQGVIRRVARRVQEDERRVGYGYGYGYGYPATRSSLASVASSSSSLVHLPLEIKIMIIDELYMLPDFSRNAVSLVRRTLHALGWNLPNSYWISRCSMDLGFDVMGIPNIDKVVDWGEFCTTLEYKLAGNRWWCISGLALRESILNRLKAVRGTFLKRVERENKAVEISEISNGER
ncbi:hypothetical protein BJY00DRAFT_319413 [Aspergillus carlsbadensis]|nr:hypothetical protein BJY00DRAFT_319413 [Aspergillus carlsbadensis]